ncbi:MAG: metallophosphoesterase [Candidatus Nanohaloarchaea archaeon]|nr:metallophosphoesterase [Candidatus Nanohaloarchaea archaeon]
MELLDGFRVVDEKPAVYVERLDALVVADTHIGIEVVEARSGTLMPKFQLDELLEELEAMQEETEASTLIVDGDVKHSFSGKHVKEREEVQEFLDTVSMLFDTVKLVRGNHDNALEYRVEDYTNVELADHFLEEDIYFTHGDEEPEDLGVTGAATVVIGHEHPAIAVKDEVGVKEKIACFLYGPMGDGRDILVLPAFTKLAAGTEVNEVPKRKLLSPLLRSIDVDALTAVAVDREAGVFEYPTIGELREL